MRRKTSEVLDLTQKWQGCLFSISLAVLEVQFGKSKSFKWKRHWGEHSLHCSKTLVLKSWPARPSGVAREAIFIGKKT